MADEAFGENWVRHKRLMHWWDVAQKADPADISAETYIGKLYLACKAYEENRDWDAFEEAVQTYMAEEQEFREALARFERMMEEDPIPEEDDDFEFSEPMSLDEFREWMDSL